MCEDGRSWQGWGFAAAASVLGECVFTTGMTGYQETLTDPSYHRQIVVQTAPHIGNTGMNDEDAESDRIWAAGYVIRDLSPRPSNWRSTHTLAQALLAGGVPGLHTVDTRAITRHIRSAGAMRAGLFVGADAQAPAAELLARVRDSAPMAGAHLVAEVTAAGADVRPPQGVLRYRVGLLDCGCKQSIVTQLRERGCEVTVWPAHTSAAEILARRPDGVMLSNGPGDPAAAEQIIATVRALIASRTPVVGICFGHQLIGRALGLPTRKLPFGHRGINQPVIELATGRVSITSQNHGFAVEVADRGELATPFGRVRVTHVSLNDGVVEGLACLDAPVRSVQYHPEAAAGPHDAAGVFDDFLALMASSAAGADRGELRPAAAGGR